MPCTSINYQYMAKEIPKLIGHWGSSFVSRVRIALHLKGLEYHFLEESIGSNGQLEKSHLLLQSNPVYKKIPVFIHNGNPICESYIIVEYIDDVWLMRGLSILPLDPYERAHARFWGTFIDKLYTSYISIIAKKTTEEAKVQGVERTISCLKSLQDYLEEKPFFGGDEIGYVDIALGSRLSWFKVVEEVKNVRLFDEERLPNLVKWAEQFWLDDRVKGMMPEHNKLVEFCKVLQETVWKSEAAS